MTRKTIILLIFLATALIPLPSSAQELIRARAVTNLNVRATPGINGDLLGTLDANAIILLEGRNQSGDWILMHNAANTLRGWVAVGFIELEEGSNTGMLPVTDGVAVSASDQGDGPTSDAFEYNPTLADFYVPVPNSVYGDMASIEAALNATPVLHNMNTQAVRNLFANGQARGLRRDVFTTVGDSITATQPFLRGFAIGDYDLGPYGHLQDTIDFYSQAAPRAGSPNSWRHDSYAVLSAFNAVAVLDLLWTDPNICNNLTEPPLLCEYHTARPAIAIIMLGSVDIQIYDEDLFNTALNRVIDLTMAEGVIPVLNTFPIGRDYLYWDQGMRFNMVILEVANQRGIPLINLWQPMDRMPNNGVREDRFHLSQGPTFYAFDGSENTYAVTLRNLLTLQALDELRRNVIGG
jgi:uncharacterized protein YraI